MLPTSDDHFHWQFSTVHAGRGYLMMRPARRARRRVEYEEWEWDFSGEAQDSQAAGGPSAGAEPDGQAAAAQGTRPPVLGGLRRIVGQGADELDGGVAAVGGKRGRAAASSAAVLGLEEVEAAGRQAECAVCLEEFGAGETLRAMPFSHAFHRECIFEWLRRNGVCPLCRHRLPTQQQEDEERMRKRVTSRS